MQHLGVVEEELRQLAAESVTKKRQSYPEIKEAAEKAGGVAEAKVPPMKQEALGVFQGCISHLIYCHLTFLRVTTLTAARSSYPWRL